MTASCLARPSDSLDHALRRLRVIAIAALVIVVAAVRPGNSVHRSSEFVGAGLIVLGLIASNLTSRWPSRSAEWRGWTALIAGQIVGDLVLAVAGLWITGTPPTKLATLVLLAPILEAGVRFRVVGAMTCWLAACGLLVASEMSRTSPPHDFVALGPIAVVLLFVGLPIAYLAEHLTADLLLTARAREIAEYRAELLGGLAIAARDLNALEHEHIASAVTAAVTTFGATHVRVYSQTGEQWVLLDEATTEDADASLPVVPSGAESFVAGVSVMDERSPTHALLQLAVQGEKQNVIVCAQVKVEQARLVFEALEVLGTQATVALRNAELHAKLAALNREFAYRAEHDSLTGLTNRAGLDGVLRTVFDRDPRPHIAMLYIDLDGFKHINDHHGHDIGDRVLAILAKRFVRAAGPQGLVIRIGGDEFVVLYEGDDAVRDATRARHRLEHAARQPIDVDGAIAHLGASVGLAAAEPEDEVHKYQLLARADQSMYRIKAERRALARHPDLTTRPINR